MSDGVGNLGLPSLLVAALLLLGSLWAGEARAVNGQCTSSFVATGPITSTLYQPGETSGPTAFSTTGTATCDCTGISVGLFVTVYYQGTTNLPTVSDPLGTLIKLNPYFGLKTEFNAAGGYQEVPFSATTTGLLSACVGGLLNVSLLGGINVNGGRYTLKLLKGVTGTQTFNGTVAHLFVRRASVPDTSPVNAFSTLAMNISVTSTPTCQFPAGTSIPIDLGAVA